MTDSIDQPSTPDRETGPQDKLAPWVMLITLLLLISVLLFSSAMLVHYGFQRRGGTQDAGYSIAGLIEHGEDFAAQFKRQPKDKSVSNPDVSNETSGIMKFFPAANDSVKWPKLKLTGFGKGVATEDGFAIINGKQLMIGGQVGDVTVKEIRTHGVVVELQGEQKTLTVEQPK